MMTDYEKMRRVDQLLEEAQKMIYEATRLEAEVKSHSDIMLSTAEMFIERHIGGFCCGFLFALGIAYLRWCA